MTINGSTNNSGWTYKLEVTETSTSIQNRTSTVQVKAYLGRANSLSWVAGNWTGSITVAGQTQSMSGTIPYQTWVNPSEPYELATKTFTVSNTGNPTIISISSSFSSGGNFTPETASASGTMQLTILHLDPTIQTAEITETDATMISLGIPDTTVVRWLSQKQIKLNATSYDSATLSYRIKLTGFSYDSGVQNSDTFNIDFRQNEVGVMGGIYAPMTQYITDSMGGSTSGWVRVEIGGEDKFPNLIPYAKPVLVSATNIKRKSGTYSSILQRVANLTDGIASINVSGTIYKEDDAVGNNNAIRTIGYKVWEQNTSEPANYTLFTVSPTIDGNNVTIDDYEIQNIDFTKVYNYKIILEDIYTDGTSYYSDIITGTIPLGQSLWTEYKDRVDFLKLTVKGYNPFEYSETETICGEWLGETLYRKVIYIGTLPNNSSVTVSTGLTNADIRVVSIYGACYTSDGSYQAGLNDYNSRITLVPTDSLTVTTKDNYSSFTGYVVIEYVKVMTPSV